MTSRYKPLPSVYHWVNNLEDRLTIHISKDKNVLKWWYPLFNSPCCALRCIGLEAHTGNWVSFHLTLVLVVAASIFAEFFDCNLDGIKGRPKHVFPAGSYGIVAGSQTVCPAHHTIRTPVQIQTTPWSMNQAPQTRGN